MLAGIKSLKVLKIRLCPNDYGVSAFETCELKDDFFKEVFAKLKLTEIWV